jgi:hypothetical protein
MPPHISMLTAEPVRQFITAGSAGEAVPANSVFTPAFIDGLAHGLADLDKDGYITGTELGVYLQGRVPLHVKQTPQFGKINDYELSRGDFVFPPIKLGAQNPDTPSGEKFVPPPSSPTVINPGDRVLAGWQEKDCLYLGDVIESRDNKYNVHYDFSGDAWVGADQIFLYKSPAPSELAPGAKVFVGLESGSKWARGRIKENRNGQFLIRLDDKYECRSQKDQHWATAEMLILRK